MPEGEAVRDNLDAPCIGYRHIDIHVCEPDVAGDPRAGLPADASGKARGGHDPKGGTRGVYLHGARRRGNLKRRSRRTRNSALGMVMSSRVVGVTLKTQAAKAAHERRV